MGSVYCYRQVLRYAMIFYDLSALWQDWQGYRKFFQTDLWYISCYKYFLSKLAIQHKKNLFSLKVQSAKTYNFYFILYFA